MYRKIKSNVVAVKEQSSRILPTVQVTLERPKAAEDRLGACWKVFLCGYFNLYNLCTLLFCYLSTASNGEEKNKKQKTKES